MSTSRSAQDNRCGDGEPHMWLLTGPDWSSLCVVDISNFRLTEQSRSQDMRLRWDLVSVPPWHWRAENWAVWPRLLKDSSAFSLHTERERDRDWLRLKLTRIGLSDLPTHSNNRILFGLNTTAVGLTTILNTSWPEPTSFTTSTTNHLEIKLKITNTVSIYD